MKKNVTPKRKLTKEIINKRLLDREVLLIGDYHSYHVKSEFQCQNGHRWMATPANILNGTGCPHCSGNIPLTREIINKRIKSLKVEMLSEYISQKSKAKFKCDCGNVWETAPNNVLYGKGCPKCSRKSAANKRRLNISTINERLINRGIKLVGEYKTANTKSSFECSNGHSWKATAGSVMKGNGCPHCSNRLPLTKEIVNKRLEHRAIELIGEYVQSNQIAEFKCEYGHVWKTTPGGVLRGSGCPTCNGQSPLNKEIINERLKPRGLEMLGKYVNVDTKSLFQCEEGHTWITTPYHVTRKNNATGCPYCSQQAPLSTEVVNERISDRGYILLDEFVTNSTKVRFQCSEGHVWLAKPNNILNGRGCPDCAIRTSDNDVFYIWIAQNQNKMKVDLNKFLIKFGVTSERLGDSRIREVACSWKASPLILAMVQTSDLATNAETTASMIGEKISSQFKHLDGWTEFRVVSEDELKNLMLIADQVAANKIVWSKFHECSNQNEISKNILNHHIQLEFDL
jgi:hypothetical protein